MQNITAALDIVYHVVETLLSIDQSNLELRQKIAILRSIEELEDVRQYLYDEKNNINEVLQDDELMS